MKSSESDFTRQNSSNLTGHWNGHSMKFKSGNYSGNGHLVTKNRIQGQWSDGTLQSSFKMTKIEPIVMLLWYEIQMDFPKINCYLSDDEIDLTWMIEITFWFNAKNKILLFIVLKLTKKVLDLIWA